MKRLRPNESFKASAWQVKTVLTLLLPVMIAVHSPALAGADIVIGGLDGLSMSGNGEHHRVLLALSGGGARGIASIGVLKAFHEKGIEVEAITGTSIGGIIGGLYACGYTPDELTSLVNNLDLTGLFSNKPARRTMFLTQRQERGRHLFSIRFDGFMPVVPRALTAGQKLTSILTTWTTRANYHAGGNFDNLAIPFKTISTDIVSGQEVVLDKGSLTDAMRATMGFPLAFTPLDKGERLLMDGGMVTPIPVQLVKSMSDSIGFTVAVNTVSPLMPKEELSTPVDIANQVTSIMTADKLKEQLDKADYAIKPPLNGISMSEFKAKESLIEIGYQAGLTAADSIIDLLHQRSDSSEFTIAAMKFPGCAATYADAIEKRLLNRHLSKARLVADLKALCIDLKLFRLEADLDLVDDTSVHDRRLSLAISILPQNRWPDVEIEFAGNQMFPDSLLTHLIKSDNDVISPSSLRHGLDKILDHYKRRGYDLVDIEGTTLSDCGRHLTVVLDEAIVTGIDIAGNHRTRSWLIRSNFSLKEGRPFSTGRASRGLANVFASDLFNRVTLDLVPSDTGARINIGVEERHGHQLRLGWHWHDEYQSEEFAEFLDNNVMGAGLQYLLHARYAPDRQVYAASLKADRILSTYLLAKLNLHHNRLNRNVYDAHGNVTDEIDENRTGLEVKFGQQISRLGTLSAGLIVQEVEYEFDTAQVREKFGLRALKFESLVETFDRLPFPESGKKHLFEIQLSGKFIGGEVEYTKFYSSIEAYWSLGGPLNYHPKLAVGLSRSGLPESEKFYLGGMKSFAGFRTDQLSGDKIMTMSHELRCKLPLRLYLSARYDIGEVYASADDIRLSGLRHGFGVTAALDSPIGPLEFGYGVADEGFERYYVNIGLAF
ncbi:MAG: BamA/TamA family outer membrane protein [candidate division Zixibacteria bacterium]|nr:BamA/TamA family outer membrane protein [candidate division Zixibacteria bacterium]MDH3936164.1 BamA/TamA family outer membrane protein [candidate division Zixibacteria bacterium]MDH4032984.1 BamA/TamA family outer membrane protein [candidate division Zixibacteria bacterium]